MGEGRGLTPVCGVGCLAQVPHPPWDLGSSNGRELDPQQEQPVTWPEFLFSLVIIMHRLCC